MKMSVKEAFSHGWHNMFNFSGRARRAEYWWFTIIIGVVLGLIAGILQQVIGDDSNTCTSICSIIAFVLTLAVSVRRLHDTGKSGWWLLLSLTGIGDIVLFIFFLLNSTPGENKFGPNPKGE